eukprot:CAMPEP_0118970630 /NCGR_PEP_ID=MMETSP1173-20130426/7484_1 /TAXON_ID=1034831 /ORGANISM="Rhizochromulina marina cf, Strain CCMP1243" /LENGTH=76 /DNA_ID=CAMNT_0006920009 /DNA_START=110 /DNA_END=337 /DNA_ORIENTATION=+
MSKDQLATSYAAIALYDGGAEITSDQIVALLKATGHEGVEPYWPVLFAGMLKSQIEELILTGSAGGGGGGGGSGGG